MTDKDYFRKEEAKDVNLIEFLQERYPDMVDYDTEKHEWRVPGTHIKVTETSFYDFDTGEGGDNIRFLTDVMHKHFFEAVDELLETDVSHVCLEDIVYKDYKVPENAYNDDAVMDYLVKRKIDREIVQRYLDIVKIYLDTMGNIVFCNTWEDFCILRSTYTDWKGIRTKVKYGYWEAGKGETNEIYIFESPIDALSFMTLYGDTGKYMAMGGLKKGTVDNIMLENQWGNTNFNLCVDWDEAGDKFAENYPEMNRIKGTKGKDWNDELNN